jgi:hypothetical protein
MTSLAIYRLGLLDRIELDDAAALVAPGELGSLEHGSSVSKGVKFISPSSFRWLYFFLIFASVVWCLVKIKV